jgi:2-C-methyl-D-erythritol 4-phosphate cytidylyltransferase
MEKYAIIVAGGSGSRMNSDVPKQFLILKGKPVLYFSINTFLQTYNDCKIILVLAEEHIGKGQEIVDAYFDYKKISITKGGRTRFHSVQNGLKLINNEDAIVFIHDAARPLLSPTIMNRCYDAVLEFGSAIPVVDCKDSVRMLTDDGNEAIERSKIKLVQTPQVFHAKIILPAFLNIDFKDKFTDEASVVEAFGLKVHLVEGEIQNIKITTSIDLLVAEAMINKSES